MDIQIGISLIAFDTPGRFRNFYSRDLPETGIDPVFELSYRMNHEYLREVADLGVVIKSAHAPCPSTEILPNLGSRNLKVIDESLEIIRESAKTAASLGGDVLVLHAGYATDERVYTEFAQRRMILEQAALENSHVLRKEGMICRPEYCDSKEYRLHLEEIVKNLPSAVDVCRSYGVSLAVENINPRVTYLLQRPEDVLYIAENVPGVYICLDFGHLWLSSIVHGFDFLKAVEIIIGTGRVVTTHIHDNYSTSEDVQSLEDEHHGIGKGIIPFDGVVDALSRGKVERWIIEAQGDPIESLLYLSRCRASVS